jgi:hypothetical protein
MLANTKVDMGGYGITHQIKKNTLLLLSVVMILIDVIKDDTIIPIIEIIQKEPAVCDIKNKTEVKKKIESIVKFIYNMDMNRKPKK